MEPITQELKHYAVWYFDRHGDKDYDLVWAPTAREAFYRVHRRSEPFHATWVDEVTGFGS